MFGNSEVIRLDGFVFVVLGWQTSVKIYGPRIVSIYSINFVFGTNSFSRSLDVLNTAGI